MRACSINWILFLAFFSAFTGLAQTFDPNYLPQIKCISWVNSVSETPEGDFIIAGNIDYYNDTNTGSVFKLDRKGGLVPGFNSVLTDYQIDKLEVLSNGKILIQGAFNHINGIQCPHLVRLNPDGSYDPTFVANANFPIGDFKVQENGRILISPKFYGNSDVLARLNPDGSLDTGFSSAITGISTIIGIAIGSDGIFIGDALNKVLKLTPQGLIDHSYNSGITIEAVSSDNIVTQIQAFTLQPDNKVVAAIGFTILRLNADGSMDNGFSVVDNQQNTRDLFIRKNGRILAFRDNGLYELNADGSVYQFINYYSLSSSAVDFVKELSDGKILVVGSKIHLLNPDGSPDTDFIEPKFSAAPQSAHNELAISFDNKLIFCNGFNFGSFGIDSIQSAIIRLNSNGFRDTTFHSPFSSATFVASLSLQEDGKILVGGFVPSGIIRLLNSGEIDTSFHVGSGYDGGVVNRIYYNGSHIFVGGSFNSFNGAEARSIVRLNKDGSMSQAFTGLPQDSYITNFDVQSDGKIVVIGEFKLPEGRLGGMRLNADGTLDKTFPLMPLESFNGILSIKIDAQDKTYLGGNNNQLLRLNPNGSTDNTFFHGAFGNSNGANVSIEVVEILPSGELMIGGKFTTYKQQVCNGIVILNEDGTFKIPSPVLDASSNIQWVKYGQESVYIGGRISFDGGQRVGGMARLILDRSTIPLPNAPKNLSGNFGNADGLVLNWVYGSGAEDGFEIQKSVGNTDNFSTYSSVYRKNYSFKDQDIDSTKKYYYRVKAFNAKGSSGFTNVFSYPADLTTAVEPSGNSRLSFYPNPAKDLVKINLDAPLIELYIFDQLGRTYTADAISSDGDSAQVQINSLPKGFYIFSIKTEISLYRARVIKQ